MGLKQPINEKQHYTISEYLEIVDSTDSKLAYSNGKITAMAGGTVNHSKLCNNMGALLFNALYDKDCSAYNSDLKVWLPANNSFAFPDVSVVCDPIEYYENRRDIITNPSLIVEVLSPSTANYDRMNKFSAYRALPSFKEYIIIYTTEIKVEGYFRKEKDLWLIQTALSEEATLTLHSIGTTVSLRDIYRKVAFE